MTTAHVAHEIIDELGVVGYPKISGSSCVVDIVPLLAWADRDGLPESE